MPDRRFRIMVAPTGARRGKADHPALPVTPAEIAATAAECFQAGAGWLHLHVRDAQGRHSLDPGLYRETIAAVAEAAPQMGIQVTTEAAGVYSPQDQLRVLTDLRPAAASAAVREIARDAAVARRFYGFAAEAGIDIQHIVFDVGDIARLRAWLADGTVPEAMRSVLLVTGRYAPPRNASVAELRGLLEALGGDFPDWMVCAFGPTEQGVLMAAAALGGSLRVGFENNIHRPDGTLAASNAENVARLMAALRSRDRALAS